MHADKILMLNEGKVIQRGDHASLSRVAGVYQRLCQIQGAIQAQVEQDLTAIE